MGEEVELLEDDPDPAPYVVHVLSLELGYLLALDHDRAAVGRREQIDAAKERRLTRPGRADHARDRAALDFEVDAGEHVERAEALVHIAKRESRGTPI